MTTFMVATSNKSSLLSNSPTQNSENPYSQIDVSIDGIPYHTKEEDVELKEYIKRTLGVSEEIGSTDPLMKNHVRIHQLILDTNNARIGEPFQYTRTTVWVSPSG
jgi:hypothetical protein